MKKLFLLCFVFSSSVFADCDYNLTAPVFNYSLIDFNPTSPGIIRLGREKDNGRTCSNFFLTFSKGFGISYNRRAINLLTGDMVYYNLYKSSNGTGVLKDLADITSASEVISGSIVKNETKTLTYYFTPAPVDASTPPRAGTYTDIIKVQTYSGFYNGSNKYEIARDLYVYINVAKSTSLSLVNTGESYDPLQTFKTLDFGTLETDEELSFDVRVVSNAGYILKVSSGYNEKLKRIDSIGIQAEVDYDFYANGSKKDLSKSSSSAVTIASGTGRTPAGGAKIPVRVVIGSIEDKEPGNYQDYITLTVVSND